MLGELIPAALTPASLDLQGEKPQMPWNAMGLPGFQLLETRLLPAQKNKVALEVHELFGVHRWRCHAPARPQQVGWVNSLHPGRWRYPSVSIASKALDGHQKLQPSALTSDSRCSGLQTL